MGEHNFNPKALMKKAMPPMPRRQLGVMFHDVIEPKPTILFVKPEHAREVEGVAEFFIMKHGEEPSWQVAPEGHKVKIVGQPLEIGECDYVVRLMGACQHTASIVNNQGQPPTTLIPVGEFFRADATAWIAKHEEALRGGISPAEQKEKD